MTRAQAYQLLGLKPGATEEEIRRQYKRMALKVHPDLNPDPRANEQFIQLTRAVEVLFSPEQPAYPYEQYGNGRRSKAPETEEEKKRRMDEARKRYEQQKARKYHEDDSYFRYLTTGRRWAIFKWVIRAGWLLALVLTLDAFLPTHLERDELTGYSGNEHNGILFERISAVHLKNNGIYFLENKRSAWLNSYNTEVVVEKTWILHTPVSLYSNNDFDLYETGFDFHIGAIRWLLVILLLVPLLTYFRQRKDLTFVFLYMFSFWGTGILILYLLCTKDRLTHLLTLGFL
jgi:hypothetical protein